MVLFFIFKIYQKGKNMEKEKIVLNDGTEFEIENGAIENCVQIICTDLDDFKEKHGKFTEENLENYKILNSKGLTCATFNNKCLVSSLVEQATNGFRISFNLTDVDMLEKRVKSLEESQDIQDVAIVDLGTIVNDLASVGE